MASTVNMVISVVPCFVNVRSKLPVQSGLTPMQVLAGKKFGCEWTQWAVRCGLAILHYLRN